MAIELRDYQQEAVEAARNAVASGKKRPLIVSPTASGKSVMIAEICRLAIRNKSRRVLVLCYQGEILA